jgi:hypothetical protein
MSDSALPFRHAVVRDLAWVMASPGLLGAVPAGVPASWRVSDEQCRAYYQSCQTQLTQLDANPEPLMQWLKSRHSHRLGVYFESLLGFWLQHLLGAQPLRQNLPVFRPAPTGNGRQTLGEFDFLFALADGGLRHWEAAVKFYLWHRDEAQDRVRWIGPGARDRLDIKLERLFGHQLRLAATAEGAAVIRELGQGPVNAAAFVKGYLFYPPSVDKTGVAAEGQRDIPLSPNHLRGWWQRHESLVLRPIAPQSRWLVLPRLRWLTPAYGEFDQAALLDASGVRQLCDAHFAHHASALLLAEVVRVAGVWQEVNRGFVVNAAWPNQG